MLSSCSSDDTTPRNPSEPNSLATNDANLYALTVGNFWEYRIFEYDQEIASYIDSDAIHTIEIVQIVKGDDGNTDYKFKRNTEVYFKNHNVCFNEEGVF